MFYSKIARNVFLTSLIISLISIVTLLFFYNKYFINSPQKIAEREVNKLVSDVGRIIDLPKDELPLIATVKSTDDLNGQFFLNVKIGHKILIYEKNKKAILYNPITNKIVEVSHLGISSE